MTAIRLSRIHFPISTLGPGLRLGVWFQGCSIRCEGCVSMDTWSFNQGLTTVEAVLDAITPALSKANGVTISGGEPFDQPEALRALLKRVRSEHNGDVLVFSGYALESLQPLLFAFEGLIDALITDPFRRDQPQTLALRGSDNQRLITLTSLGQQRFRSFERPIVPEDRAFDIMFDDSSGNVFLAGIPRPGDMNRLAELLRDQGHRASSTEDGRLNP
jgi:anaerobic ribonucleoside-triphosphate reductase activating protein